MAKCTCFGRQSHPSSGVHKLYMATGKLAHLGCKFVRFNRKHNIQQDSDYLQLHNDRTTVLLTNLQPKWASLPVVIYSLCTPDDGWDCHPKHVEWATAKNKNAIVAACWTYWLLQIMMHGTTNIKNTLTAFVAHAFRVRGVRFHETPSNGGRHTEEKVLCSLGNCPKLPTYRNHT